MNVYMMDTGNRTSVALLVFIYSQMCAIVLGQTLQPSLNLHLEIGGTFARSMAECLRFSNLTMRVRLKQQVIACDMYSLVDGNSIYKYKHIIKVACSKKRP